MEPAGPQQPDRTLAETSFSKGSYGMDAPGPSAHQRPAFVYLNGKIVPREQAAFDVEDRAALFGDGVYEFLRYNNGVAFEMERHLARLRKSLIAVGMDADLADMIGAASDRLIRENGLSEAKAYWHISRGSAQREHAIPRNISPNVLVLNYAVDAIDHAQPPKMIRTILHDDLRWQQCWIKSLNLLPNILARTRAIEADATEAILHRQGTVTEGTSSNVLIVQDGVLRTHPANHLILHGVTRAVVLELAATMGLSIREQAFTIDELFSADEAMITSTTMNVTAVSQVDAQLIGDGYVGPVTQRLHQRLLAHIRQASGLQAAAKV
jgi:D-alanine transaminase